MVRAKNPTRDVENEEAHEVPRRSRSTEKKSQSSRGRRGQRPRSVTKQRNKHTVLHILRYLVRMKSEARRHRGEGPYSIKI